MAIIWRPLLYPLGYLIMGLIFWAKKGLKRGLGKRFTGLGIGIGLVLPKQLPIYWTLWTQEI